MDNNYDWADERERGEMAADGWAEEIERLRANLAAQAGEAERLRAELDSRAESAVWWNAAAITESNDRLLMEARARRAEKRAERLEAALEQVKDKLEFVAKVRGGHGAFAATYRAVTDALAGDDQ